MKRILIAALGIICFMGIPQLTAQERDTTTSPNFPKMDASPMDLTVYRDSNDDVIARVLYSRPTKRDRVVFGKLVPYGQVWRTGANEATEITLYKDMKVGDAVVEAGTYTLFSIPEEKEWTIILSQNTHTWGAYEYTDEEDLVRITVPVRQSSTNIENLSMAFERTSEENGTDLLIGWDDKYVRVPFKNVN
ncbi:MAG TPA: DUF2911 domain-containing protein [Salegentibacter sp.]|nr:DUF2911 domain-containing protein [Salegentibacter sp.]